MPDLKHYVIRGGIDGRERLRIIGRVMHETSAALFDRLPVAEGMACLDVGCGGGDATLGLARRVGPRGRVVGLDIDAAKLEIARAEARERDVDNVEFLLSDIREGADGATFDVVYSRFLLTHLRHPAAAVHALLARVRPGGVLAVEDVDFSGYFTHPACAAFAEYHRFYCATVSRRGGDPNIGPRLPGLLARAGAVHVDVRAVQVVATRGEAKLISPLTMENIAGAVLEDGLATRAEIDGIVRELYAFADDPETMAGTPRVIQAWGRRPGG